MLGLVVSSDSGFAVIRMAGKCRIVMANAVQPSWLLSLRAQRSNPKTSVACNAIASTTPQEWLVAGSHLGFAEKSFHSIAMTKSVRKNRNQVYKRLVMANAVQPSVSKEIAAPCIQHGAQQEACGKFSRECQEPCARTAGKCKDAKKSGVSPSIREGSGKWLCLGINS